jgi:hypothetical protein
MSPVRLLSAILVLCLVAAPASRAILSGGGDTPSATTPDPLDKIRHLPESNPYRAVLAQWLSLPATDRGAIADWANGDSNEASPPAALGAEQKALARQFASALRGTASAPPTTPADWPLQWDPLNPDDPTRAMFPEVGELRALARATVKIADESPPADAIALYAATARLGRETRQGATLIQKLTGVAIDGLAQADAARRLGEFSPAELEALSAAWRNLPAASGIEPALEAERNRFFIPIFEKQILPGLRVYFAAGEPAFDKLPDDAKADAAIARLRLSALVDFGDGEKQITLENRDTGESFTVTKKRPAEGVELLDFDIPGHRATIRVHGREALVNLQTKEIVAHSETLKKFRAFLETSIFAEDENASPHGPLTRRAWLDLIKNHPNGVDGYYTDILARYDAIFAQQLAESKKAEYPERSVGAALLTNERDPILAMITPSVGGVARSLHAADVNATMLEAAIRHRLGQTTQAPADPWSATSPDETAAPFTYEPTPDGGFTLASRYHRRKDEPVTYKFAAPDAGVVRRPAPAPAPTSAAAP